MSDWTNDCNRYWGRVLTGAKAHWCPDWDYLPIDETTKTEIDCCTCEPPDLCPDCGSEGECALGCPSRLEAS